MDENKKLKELQQYCEKQFEQILTLQKQNLQLKTENEHLKSLLSSTVPIMQQEVKDHLTDEAVIADREIKKLKTLSESQALTLEECKKLVEYVKILHSQNKKEKPPISENITNNELLKYLQDINKEATKNQ